MTDLAARVRAERIRAGLSQTALAGPDFSPSYVSLIESGRRIPTDSALSVLAARLGTTAEFLRFGEHAPSEERARLEIAYARIALVNGEAEEARRRLLEIDLTTVAVHHQHEALRVLAEAHEAAGDLDSAVDVLEPLLAEALERGRFAEAAEVGSNLVATYHEAGDLGRSLDLGDRVLAAVEAAGLAGTDEHLRLAATVLWSSYERGDLLFATHRARDRIALAERCGSARGRGSIYWNAALVAEGRGDIAEACRLTDRALAYLSEGAASRDVPRLRLHYAWLLLRADTPDARAALAHLESARADLVLVGSEIELARCDVETGRAHLLLGDDLRAEEMARAGLARLEGKVAIDACSAMLLLGDVMAARGEMVEARHAYSWAADTLGMMSAGRSAAGIWRALGDRLVRHGDLTGAVDAYDRALREVGVRPSAHPVSSAVRASTVASEA